MTATTYCARSYMPTIAAPLDIVYDTGNNARGSCNDVQVAYWLVQLFCKLSSWVGCDGGFLWHQDPKENHGPYKGQQAIACSLQYAGQSTELTSGSSMKHKATLIVQQAGPKISPFDSPRW